MKLKVLFILPSLHAGGAENYALRFIRYCGDYRFDWHVLSLNLQKGDLHEAFIQSGCTVHYQSAGYFNPCKAYRLYKLFKKEEYDAVCTFNGNFGGLSLSIARMAGVPNRIAWHRRSSDAFGKNPVKKLYNQFVNRLIRLNATAVLSNSKHAFNTFYGSYFKRDLRFKVIPNGVDAAKFKTEFTKEEARNRLNIPDNIFLIGHVGRYDPAKNHETIFKVAAVLKKTNSNVRFLFCGKDTAGVRFKNRLKAHGIEDICFAIGLTDELPLILKAMDLFYFPSLTEGQPNAMIEAMVAGVPVLPADIPPILEALPKKAKTIEAIDVKSTVVQISRFIREPSLLDNLIYKQWAIGRFDYEKNFELFKCELNG